MLYEKKKAICIKSVAHVYVLAFFFIYFALLA